MKIILSVIVVILIICTQSVYAQVIHSNHPQADFKSGYDHGVANASDPCNNNPQIECYGPAYVWKSPNGFINQTNDFIDGYITGFCKIVGRDNGMDEPEAAFDCIKGPSSADWMIGKTLTGTYTSKFPERNPN